jgi:phosphatidylglycerophosphate synthase
MDLLKGYYRLKFNMGKYFASLPITTNTYTLMVLVLAIIASFALVFQQVLLAGILIIISGFFDVIDGSVARIRKRETVFGAWFADLADKGAETCLLFGISFINCAIPYLNQNFAVLLLFTFAFIFSYIKPHGYFWKAIKKRDKPIVGFDRNSRLGVMYLGLLLYSINPSYLGWSIIIALAISFIKLVQSVQYLLPRVIKELRK